MTRVGERVHPVTAGLGVEVDDRRRWRTFAREVRQRLARDRHLEVRRQLAHPRARSDDDDVRIELVRGLDAPVRLDLDTRRLEKGVAGPLRPEPAPAPPTHPPPPPA